jgi:hypothetical protein
MTQGVDRVESSGTTGRGAAKQDADGGGEQKGDDIDLQIKVEETRSTPFDGGSKIISGRTGGGFYCGMSKGVVVAPASLAARQ